MEIICIDKRTFDELVVRFSMIEKKVTGICLSLIHIYNIVVDTTMLW